MLSATAFPLVLECLTSLYVHQLVPSIGQEPPWSAAADPCALLAMCFCWFLPKQHCNAHKENLCISDGPPLHISSATEYGH